MKLLEVADSLPEIVERVGPDTTISGIQVDSRLVEPGNLFVAIPGVHVDGHRFVGEAVDAGAAAVIGEVSGRALRRAPGTDFSYIRVSDARAAWAWACAAWEGFPSRDLTLIGVTGTDGKTTTVSLTQAVLRAAGIKVGAITTVKMILPPEDLAADGFEELDTGLHTTTPDPPEIQRALRRMVNRGATHAVLEVTSHGLEQQRVAACEFDVAVVTNVTHEHLDYHGSFQAYLGAKARLFESLKHAFRKPGVPKLSVLNRDDASFSYLRAHDADRHIIYSKEQSADVSAHNIALGAKFTQFRLCTQRGQLEIGTSLVGGYNVSNALAAASVGVGLGVPLEAIAEGVASVSGVTGRMERIDEGQPFVAIVDFAHTPNALSHALGTARDIVGEQGRVIVVFGSAGLRDRGKRRMMGRIAGRLADVVVITAEDPRTESLNEIMRESAVAAERQGKRVGEDLYLVPDRGAAIQTACRVAQPDDLVIACGKGHEQSMCFGTTEYLWDDRRAMRLAIRGKTLDTLPTASLEANSELRGTGDDSDALCGD